jgi:hypothetical protein
VDSPSRKSRKNNNLLAAVTGAAIQAGGIALLTWEQDAFAVAVSYDEGASRYRGLRGGQMVMLPDADAPGLLVKPDVACRRLDAESRKKPGESAVSGGESRTGADTGGGTESGAGRANMQPPRESQPKRFHGAVVLGATLAG